MRSQIRGTYKTLYTAVMMMRTAAMATLTVFLLTTIYPRKTACARMRPGFD